LLFEYIKMMSVGYLYHMTSHDLNGTVAGHGFLH